MLLECYVSISHSECLSDLQCVTLLLLFIYIFFTKVDTVYLYIQIIRCLLYFPIHELLISNYYFYILIQILSFSVTILLKKCI